MKNKKILLMILLLLAFVNVGFSALTDGNIAYWSFDGNVSDISGNGYDGVNHGASFENNPSINDQSIYFDEQYHYVNTTLTGTIVYSNDWTISAWVLTEDTSGYQIFLNKRYADNPLFDLKASKNSNGTVTYSIEVGYWSSSSDAKFLDVIKTIPDDNKFHFVVAEYNHTTHQYFLYVDGIKTTNYMLYVNGIKYYNKDYLNYDFTENVPLQFGIAKQKDYGYQGYYFNGYEDEVGIWDRALTDQEIQQLYNNGAGFNPYAPLPRINIQNISLINNSYLNTSDINISINLNTTYTNNNTNISYSLNGNSYTQFVTNNLTGTLTLNNLADGKYTISFYAWNNETNITSKKYTFTIDTIKPNLIQLPFEITYNQLNFSNFCNDLNLLICNITINNQTYQNNENITFSQAQNYSYTIQAQDKANNTNSLTGIILYIPYVSFYVYDTKRKINLTNYYLNNIQSPYNLTDGTYFYSEITKIKYFDVPNQIKVSKNLYPSTFYNITKEQKDSGLIQLNLTPATIDINLYDYDTKSLLSNWSIIIKKNDITYLSESNLSNFSHYYSNDISGKLNIELLKNGYFTSYLNPNLDINSSISHNVYLVSSSNPKIFPLEVKDRSGTKYLSDVVISVYIIQDGSSDEYFTTQVKTDSTGKVYLFLDSTKNYKLVLSKDGYVRTIEYITPTDYQLTFYMTSEVKDYSFDYAGFTYYIDQINTSNQNLTEFYCYYEDSEMKINSVECSVTRSYDTLFDLKTTSTNSLSDKLILSVPRTLTFRKYQVHMRVIRSGKEYNFYKTFSVDGLDDEKSKIEYKISDVIKNSSLNKSLFLVPLAILFMLLGSILMGSIGSYLALLLFLPISFYLGLLSGWLSSILEILTFVMLGLKFLFGGNN